jgi:hypothetical protein
MWHIASATVYESMNAFFFIMRIVTFKKTSEEIEINYPFLCFSVSLGEMARRVCSTTPT